MMVTESHRKLLYRYEVVRARLAIREHYLKTIVREVYENIGQVLSLVRVQLSLLDTGIGVQEKETIDSSGKLVGSAIRDLRGMCQRFQPELEIGNAAGFHAALAQEIKNNYPGALYCNKTADSPAVAINSETALILFNLLLDVLSKLKEEKSNQLSAMEISYFRTTVVFTIKYQGTIKKSQGRGVGNEAGLSVAQRARLLKGSLEVKRDKNDEERIKLVIPIN